MSPQPLVLVPSHLPSISCHTYASPPVIPASHLLSFPQFLAGIQKKSPRRPYLLITVQRTGQRHWIPVCTGMTEGGTGMTPEGAGVTPEGAGITPGSVR